MILSTPKSLTPWVYIAKSDEYKDGWNSYFHEIEKEREKLLTEKRDLKGTLNTKKGDELKRAEERLLELESDLAYQKNRDSRNQIVSNNLEDTQVLFDHKLQCPKDSKLNIWLEPVWSLILQDFPTKQNYIALGCKNSKGTPRGPFIAWYSSGQVILEGEYDGLQTFYYPNGKKAAEAKSTGGQFVEHIKSWSIHGKLID